MVEGGAKTFTAAFMAKVALEAIRGVKSSLVVGTGDSLRMRKLERFTLMARRARSRGCGSAS
jgi:predicted membrane-bound spermidine synthase